MTTAAGRIPVLVGIDLGSTRTKVVLVTPEGALVGLARAEHPTDADPSTGRAEQDPEAWWAGLGSATRAALTGTKRTGDLDVLGICVAGHGPTLTAVDADGRPVRPAITWLDTRARQDQVELEGATGLRGWALGVLPAARWLERHEPESAARTTWYLNSWEALALRLCGRAATTIVPGGSPLPLDAAQVLGLDTRRIAPEASTGTILGGLVPDAASHLGVTVGTPVVAGLVDAFASFHGARMLGAGDSIDVGGTAGGFGVYSDREIHVAGGFTTPAPLPGLYSVGGAMAATGAALDWFAADVLGGVVATGDLISEAAGIAPGADGLVFLPYLAGERSPLWDPHARGAFVGLSLRHTRAHMTRAILEAAALAIRHVAQPILEAGIEVAAMRACGGPARSDLWNQIKADVTGFPVEVPRARETAGVGAAIVAAVGVGAHADLPSAIRSMTAIDRRFEPLPEAAATYDRVYEAYVALYPALAPIVRRLQPDPNATPAAVAV
jgi:xylulokinase